MLCSHQTRNIDTTQPEAFQENVAMCITHIHLDILKTGSDLTSYPDLSRLLTVVTVHLAILTLQNTENNSDELNLFFTDERFKWRPGSSLQTGAVSGPSSDTQNKVGRGASRHFDAPHHAVWCLCNHLKW